MEGVSIVDRIISDATFPQNVYIVYPEPVNLLFYIAKRKLKL